MTQEFTRRKFIQQAAATVAAPYFLTSAALGQPGSGRPAAGGRVTIGAIGHGNQMGGLLGGFMGSAQVVAVCDVDAAKLAKAKDRVDKQYGSKDCKTYGDFRELLARDDIDAIVAAVPDHWHAVMSIEAAKAGKDIYCEKPLSLTIREARLMVDAVRRYGRVFQTGSMQRSSQNFRYACELVRNGRIGRVRTIEVGLPNNGKPAWEQIFPAQPIPPGFDYDMWLGPAPWVPYNSQRVSGNYGGGWRYVRDSSGGMMTDWGAHHFDIAQWALGMDNSGPVEVIPPGSQGKATLTFRYANGVEMFLGGPNGLLFTGDEGKIFVSRGKFQTWPESIGRTPVGSDEINLYRSNSHAGDWLNCIKTRQRPICDVEVGARSVTVCHLGSIAQWVGRPLRWDPVKETIVGDEEAARWMDRPSRAPWQIV